MLYVLPMFFVFLMSIKHALSSSNDHIDIWTIIAAHLINTIFLLFTFINLCAQCSLGQFLFSYNIQHNFDWPQQCLNFNEKNVKLELVLLPFSRPFRSKPKTVNSFSIEIVWQQKSILRSYYCVWAFSFDGTKEREKLRRFIAYWHTIRATFSYSAFLRNQFHRDLFRFHLKRWKNSNILLLSYFITYWTSFG